MSDREYLLDIMCNELRDGVPAHRSYFAVRPLRREKPEPATPAKALFKNSDPSSVSATREDG
jgi:hypothetical protein